MALERKLESRQARFRRAGALLAVLWMASAAHGAIIVDGRGPDSSNRRPGLQNTVDDWTDPLTGDFYRNDPADASVTPGSPSYGVFQTLQAALYAHARGWFPAEDTIEIRTNAPLPGVYPQPSASRLTPNRRGNIPVDIVVRKKVTIRPTGTSRAIIEGGTFPITVRARDVVLERLELRDGISGGLLVDTRTPPVRIPDLVLTDVHIHDNGGNGIHVHRVPDYFIHLRDGLIDNNQRNGFHAFESFVSLTLTKVRSLGPRIINNRGHGIYLPGPMQPGPNPKILHVDTSGATISNNDRDGVRIVNNVRLIMDQSVVEGNGGEGVNVSRVRVTNMGPHWTVITDSEIRFNDGGGVRLEEVTNRGRWTEISDSDIVGNKLWGVLLVHSPVRIESGSQVSGNRRDVAAARGGFGIWMLNQSELVLLDSRVNDNAHSGIFAVDQSTLKLTDSEIVNNGWKGVSVENSSLSAERIEVFDNSSSGVSARRNSTAVVTDSSIKDNDGHGIYANESKLEVTGGFVLDNGRAGLFALEGSTVTLSRTVVQDNAERGVSLRDGSKGTIGPGNDIWSNLDGGIKVQNCPDAVVIKENSLIRNESKSHGGGILVWDPGSPVRHSNPTIVDNRIKLNTARESGGGIAVREAQATIGKRWVTALTPILRNQSLDGIGGGIAVLDPSGPVLIAYTFLHRNKAVSRDPAKGRGGGIAVQHSPGTPPAQMHLVRIHENLVAKNTAQTFGGGIFTNNARVDVVENHISRNRARGQQPLGPWRPMGLGGGIYTGGAGQVVITRSEIDGNHGTGVHLQEGGGHVVGGEIGVRRRNRGHGVSILNSKENRIESQIRGNRGAGVWVGGTRAIRNDISGPITASQGRGIELWDGGNREVLSPVFTKLDPVRGAGLGKAFPGLTSTGPVEVRIWEDPNGEGASFVALTRAVPPAYDFQFNLGNARVSDLTATLTDRFGNTSEFSAVLFNLNVSGLAESEEVDPGKALPINDDDDGAPPGPDSENLVIDAGSDEKDMAELEIEFDRNSLDGGTLALETPSPGLRVFDSTGRRVLGPGIAGGPSATPRYQLPQAEINGGGPLEYRAEGTMPGRHFVDLVYRDRKGRPLGKNRVRITVYSLKSVEWFPKPGQLSPNPGAGGGQRVFAGSLPLIYAVAQVEPSIEGVPIYFRLIDVDDPSTSTPPLDDESSSADNRGAVRFGAGDQQGATTWRYPQSAFAFFEPSLQPGDNYRFVASIHDGFFADLTAPQSGSAGLVVDGNGRPVPDSTVPRLHSRRVTDLLTVWRKLNVNLYAMNAPPPSRFPARVLTSNRVGATRVKVTLSSALGVKDDELESGFLDVVTLGLSHPIEGNVTSGNRTVVEIVAPLGTPLPAPNSTVSIRDDDKPSATPALPSTAMLSPLFAPAYVEPVFIRHAAPWRPFLANVETGADWQIVWGGVPDANGGTKWHSHVMAAFQGHPDSDLDPDFLSPSGRRLRETEGGPTGGDLFQGRMIGEGETRAKGNFSLIYSEVVRDGPRIEAQVVGHQLGLQFDGLLSDGGIMKNTPTGFAGTAFTPVTLDKIRSASQP